MKPTMTIESFLLFLILLAIMAMGLFGYVLIRGNDDRSMVGMYIGAVLSGICLAFLSWVGVP